MTAWPFTILLTLFGLPAYAADCIPTPHRTTGTHYEPVTEQKIDIGTGVIVQGKVLAMPDCKPVTNARVAHWQAGIDGEYADRLRAYLFTDDEGRFKFETEWPNINPPHIHFIVTSNGYDILETQWIGNSQQSEINFNLVLGEKENRSQPVTGR